MRKLFSYLLILSIITFLNPFAGVSSANQILQKNDAGNDQQTTTLPKGVSIYQLDNGMQVVMIENPALPMVGVNVVVKVGSAYETFATSGMSHMLEHLLFNGTTEMTQQQLYDAVDKIGGYNNANTDLYYTNFMMVTPFDKIDEGMKIQSDMLFNSTMPVKKFKKEKGIVMEEIAKTLAKPREQLERNLISVIYKGHALSLPTLGTYETIKNMKRDDVYKFYKNYYVPNNMIMSVIGNFNSAEMLTKIKEIYGKYAPGIINYPESINWKTGFEKPSQNYKDEDIFYRFYPGNHLTVNLYFKLPENLSLGFFHLFEISAADRKDSLLNNLGDLKKDVVSLSFDIRNHKVENYFGVTVKLAGDKNLDKVITAISNEIHKLNFSLPDETVENEAVTVQTEYYKNVEKPHMFGIFNAGKFAEYGIESVFDSYSGANYFPAAKKLNSFRISSKPVVVVQYPAAKSEKKGNENQLITRLFENGSTKSVVIAKQNKMSNLLAIHYLIKNKEALESKYGKDASFIWHDAFGQRMESPEIQKKSFKYGFDFTVNDNPYIPMDNIYLNPAFGYIRAEGLADDVPGAIKFLNEQMLNFVPTQEEYDNAAQKLMGIKMMQKGNKAKSRFNDLYKQLIYEPDKYPPANHTVNYEDLLKFGKEYFAPSNMIISVVSPGLPENINNYFSDFYSEEIKSQSNTIAYQRKFKTITEPKTVVDTVGGEQAFLFYGFIKNVDENDKASLKALSLLLGDKIIFDVREKQGMAYRMGAGIKTVDDKALFYINLGTRPENVDKLVPQFPEFFTQKYAKDVFTNDKLEKSVNMYLGRMMFRRLSSINQGYYLGYSYYFYKDINEDNDELNALKNVTLDDVKAAAKKYLKVENPVEVIVR